MFFCDAHSRWKRGSNENMNGLLRDYFPKGTDLCDVTPAELMRGCRVGQPPAAEGPRRGRPADLLADLIGTTAAATG